MSFRFQAKNLFATYPQASRLTKERVVQFFRDDLLCSEYTVGQENHSDGGIHFHCLISWLRPYDTTDPRHFDIDGHHPNIQTARSPTATYTYCTKDGDYLTNRVDLAVKEKRYADLLECPDAETFWTTVKRKYPADYVLRLDKLEYMANKHFKPVIPDYISPFTDFVITPEMERWIRTELPKVGEGLL